MDDNVIDSQFCKLSPTQEKRNRDKTVKGAMPTTFKNRVRDDNNYVHKFFVHIKRLSAWTLVYMRWLNWPSLLSLLCHTMMIVMHNDAVHVGGIVWGTLEAFADVTQC